ncbi:hypothetical protein [Hyphomonas sp.]|uniref:hypothetical protein n=1 Tax=Hyphomonas sp. TaxID=87 RepID=UPI0039194371
MFDTLRKRALVALAAVFSLGNISGCALIPMDSLWKTAGGIPYAEVCKGADGIEGGAACTLTWYQSALSAGKELCELSATERDPEYVAALESACLKVAAIDARVTPTAVVAWGLLGDVAEARTLAAGDEGQVAKAIAAARQLETFWRERGPEISEAVNAMRGD